MTVWKSIKGLRCKVCNEIIPDFSVFVEDQSYRKDMSFINGWLINYDREYYSGQIANLMYDCKCGSITINREESGKILDDFLRDTQFPKWASKELREKEYGNLIVEFNESSSEVI